MASVVQREHLPYKKKENGYDENDDNPSVRPITASTTSGTTRATSTSPSTTPMTMLTSTFAWCTPCVERARRAHSSTLHVVSHLIGSSPESFHNHLHTIHGAPSLTRFSLSTSTCSFLSFTVYFLHSELYSELDNPMVLESLCYSVNNESDDAFDVSTSLTSYEPNLLTFGELNDSSVPFSFTTPSSDQDLDDVTLGKLLTEAHWGQADYCEPEGMSVSCVRWIRETYGRKRCRPTNWFWFHKKHVQCSQRVFWKHPSWENGRSIRATWWAKQLERTD